ncbi:MAG TPA: hypothetical protein VJB09_00095, partial [Candidatus Paceibacterota bacterium]
LHRATNLEDLILLSLQKGPQNGVQLIHKIQKVRPSTTKQAVYKVLRNLKSQEVVVLHAKRVSLSQIWINKMSEYFNLARRNYAGGVHTGEDFLSLSDGDKISYNFSNPRFTDAFWIHACSILSQVMKSDEPIYFYNPHEWFLLARYDTERSFFDLIKKSNQQLLVTVSDNTVLDKLVAKEFDGDVLQYHMNTKRLFQKDNFYLNIFGDFLIEVWIDKKVSEDIDKFYIESRVFGAEAFESLQGIINQKGKTKLVISRNKAKAEKLKKLFKKNFCIRKQILC